MAGLVLTSFVRNGCNIGEKNDSAACERMCAITKRKGVKKS